MIQLDNIALAIGDRPLLNPTSLSLAPGEKTALHGPSGCGKSTLLRTLAGTLPLQQGTLHLNGQKLTAHAASTIRANIAYIGQEPCLGADTAEKALLLPFRFKAHRHRHPCPARIQELLEQVGLERSILKQQSAQLSGGEKQRLVIIRALLLEQTLFLADEPTSALDPASRTAVMKLLFKPEFTLLSVSHDPIWCKACERTFTIRNRELIETSEVPHDE